MSENKFTPGPWQVEGDDIIGRTEYVATVAYSDLLETTNAANARLIAAAPDLLAALQALVMDILDPDHEAGDWSQQVVVRHAQAAIAKAEGKS